MTDPIDADIAAVQAAYDQAEADLVEVRAGLALAQSQIADLTAGAQTNAASIKALQQQNDALTAQVAALRSQLADATVFPASGAIMSVYVPGNAVPTAVEAVVGRQVAMTLYEGFGSWGGSLKTVGTRPVRVALSTRKGTPTYASILSGGHDAWLKSLAATLKTAPNKILLDVNAEADNAASFGGTGGNSAMFDQAGTPEDLAKVVAYCKAMFYSQGCTRPVWGVCFSGWQTSDALYRRFWLADTFDWVGWDPYCHNAAKWQTPLQLWSTFYNRIQAGLFGAEGASLPLVVGETGWISDPRRVDAYEAIPAALPQLEQIKWFGPWLSKATYDYTLTPQELPALKVAAG